MDILDDMEVSKLSAKPFLKVNYSFKENVQSLIWCTKKKEEDHSVFSWGQV